MDGDSVRLDVPLAFQWTEELGGNNHYYLLTSGLASWTASQAEAVGLGGNLVTINDQAEQDFLQRKFFSGPARERLFWIGLNDVREEGVFEWASGEPVEYTNWYPGEPNDYLGNEDGTVTNWGADQGAWNDDTLSRSYYGIIELANLPPSIGLANEGVNTFSVNAGSLSDTLGTPNTAYVGEFHIDTTPPVIVSATPENGALVIGTTVNVELQFSEPMNPASVNYYQLPLIGGGNYNYPAEVSWNTDFSALSLVYYGLGEGDYELQIQSWPGSFEDQIGLALDGDMNGLEGGTYTLQITLDEGPLPLPVPLLAQQPLGSLIYSTPPQAVFGWINSELDQDDWTIELDAGQTLSILLTPQGPLLGSLQVFGPNGEIASATGVDAYYPLVLNSVPVDAAGLYTIRVSGGEGSDFNYSYYSLEATVNAALEEEKYLWARKR